MCSCTFTEVPEHRVPCSFINKNKRFKEKNETLNNVEEYNSKRAKHEKCTRNNNHTV